MERMRTLQGHELRLEPQVAAHAEEMFAVLSDPNLYAHENEPPASLEWLRERFARLESRRSKDGSELWLNWVARLPTGEAIGYVQATVHATHRAAIAYVFGSRWWGRGLATEAVELMTAELASNYEVETFIAVLKASNARSRKLLERLGFALADAAAHQRLGVDRDEILMTRPLSAAR